MWFSTFVVKNLTRRPLRSLLTIFAIAVAIGSVVSLVGIAGGFERSFLQVYEGAGVDLVVVRTGGRQRINSALDEALNDKILAIPGVRQSLPGLVDVVSFEDAGLYGVLVQGWQPETPIFDHIRVTDGRGLTREDKRSVLLGAILARNLEKRVGESIELLEGERFEVVGVYESTNVFENGALIIPLRELQRIMARPGQVTGFSIVLTNHGDPDSRAEVRHQIEALAPGITALSVRDHVESLTEIRLAKGMAWLTSTIALLIGSFGMVNTMVMSVHERTREIGILRAVGWQMGRVIRMVMLEAAFLSIIGAFCGSLGAIALLQILTRVPAVSGLIDGHINLMLIVEGFLIAIGLGFLAGIIPARRAARMSPTEALRHE
jgi:putative ABC transport system permease protein